MKIQTEPRVPRWRGLALRTIVLVAACTVSLHTFAASVPACKAGKPVDPKTHHACTQKSAAAAKGKAKSGTKSNARAKHARTSAGKQKHPVPAVIQYDNPAKAQEPAGQASVAGVSGVGTAANGRPRIHPESACFAALRASNAARHLSAKVPFLANDAAGAELFGNPGHPSKIEKTELSSVIAGYDMCLDMAASARQEAYSQEVIQLQDAYWAQTKTILTGLQNGRLSFGDAARAVSENDLAHQSRIDALTPQ